MSSAGAAARYGGMSPGTPTSERIGEPRELTPRSAARGAAPGTREAAIVCGERYSP